jgi:hypothetical protein
MRISCPNCGNDTEFYEVAEEVTITTFYVQNEDGSFTAVNDRSEVLGEVHFFCGECHQEISQFHDRFLQMLF